MSIEQKRAEAEARRTRGKGVASKVGKSLAKSGIPKASRYKSFGRDADGYVVHTSTMGRVYVHSTLSYQRGVDQANEIRAWLVADGFECSEQRVVAGHPGSIEVTT